MIPGIPIAKAEMVEETMGSQAPFPGGVYDIVMLFYKFNYFKY